MLKQTKTIYYPELPVGPVGPVGPVAPLGIVKFKTKFGDVPVIVAAACVSGLPVVTVPIVIVGETPVAPVGPVGPVTP